MLTMETRHKVPVTMRALTQRINRKLAGGGKRLVATRGAKSLEQFGAYYVISGRLGPKFSGTYIMVHKDHVDPEKLAQAVCNTSSPTWPHTFVTPKYATMGEYKQYAPANHFHMTWGLKPARLQFWMDLANVLSVTPWQERPRYVEGVDRPEPLLYLLNGGELSVKLKRAAGW